MQALTLTRPDDWHLHVRDGAVLDRVVPDTARRFARAIIMPNLKPPVTTAEQALAYRERILAAVPAVADFTPLMTLYLTETTTAADIERAKRSGAVFGVKLYPAGATTHSEAGVRHWQNAIEAIAALEQTGLPLLIHGEVTDPAVDIFDREKVFIEQHLIPLLARFPRLKVVLEHVTTSDAVDFIREARDGVAATITPQHLLLNRNALLAGGIRPHHYCLPILKRERHRQALLAAAISGSPKFFLGSDSAPHARHTKETGCGCAGIYSAHAGIELYAMAFEQAGALDKLEGFASFFGADFYGLPRNSGTLTLEKQSWTVPESVAFGDEDTLVPFYAGTAIPWRVREAR